ncbi:hypothetical protein BSKO_12652 [Bryopsis sp. KO-2023]|nr:hypothetical protein BSKO_12652 [Bryopsis sp. KO-2023]
MQVHSDSLISGLASDSAFLRAVQSQDVKGAAETAVEVLLKALPPTRTAHVQHEGPPPKKLGRKASLINRDSIIGKRMVVKSGHKRTPSELIGVEVTVLSQETAGWTQCRRADTNSIIRVHSKCLNPLTGNHSGDAAHPHHQHHQGRLAPPPLPPRKRNGEFCAGPGRKRSAQMDSLGSPFAGSQDFDLGAVDVDAETQESIHSIRKQMLDLEEFIPWNAVTKAWKSRRPAWRRNVRGAESVMELAERLKDLLLSLVWEKSWKVAHGGRAWENEVEEIVKGKEEQKKFVTLWETISREIRRWIQERDHAPQPFSVRMPPHKTARIALAALEQAAPHKKQAIEQVPLEAITNFDVEGLQHLKNLLLENKSKLCDMLDRIGDPCLGDAEKEHLLAVCEKHLLSFMGPRGAGETSFLGDRVTLDDGATTDISDYED